MPEHPHALTFTHIAQIADLVALLRAAEHGVSRAEIGSRLTLGRNAVEQRLRTAVDLGLVVTGGYGTSTGGRMPQVWRFNPEAGTILVACISIRSSLVALTDLSGRIIDRRSVESGILDDPHEVCPLIIQELTRLRDEHPELPPVWGTGVTVPAPVDLASGTLVNPVTGRAGSVDLWTRFPVKEFMSAELDTPVWIEDEVNAMAYHASLRPGAPDDLLYVRLSLGLGLGIISGGALHRGHVGTSGELAHIQVDTTGPDECRCGRRGCLETFVSGASLESAARRTKAWWKSPYLTKVRERRGEIYMEDIFRGVALGDQVCTKLAADAGIRLASVLAVLVTTYNPAEIVIGGAATESGHLFASIVDQAIRRKVLPITSSRLSVRMGGKDRIDKIQGVAELVSSWLLSAKKMAEWLPLGDPTTARDAEGSVSDTAAGAERSR